MIIVEDYVLTTTRDERRSHLKLDESCIERGGKSTHHRGILAAYLDTNIPAGKKIHLCHACNNEKCSNPRHIYWGTGGDNMIDSYECGRRKYKFRLVKSTGAAGHHWITNGIKSKFVKNSELIPDGWKLGRIMEN